MSRNEESRRGHRRLPVSCKTRLKRSARIKLPLSPTIWWTLKRPSPRPAVSVSRPVVVPLAAHSHHTLLLPGTGKRCRYGFRMDMNRYLPSLCVNYGLPVSPVNSNSSSSIKKGKLGLVNDKSGAGIRFCLMLGGTCLWCGSVLANSGIWGCRKESYQIQFVFMWVTGLAINGRSRKV
jgi:hypothetical protein